MRIDIHEGLTGARAATGAVVIIDVFRAFSLVPWAFERGAQYVIPVSKAEQAFDVRRRIPDVVLVGEHDGQKIDGFDYGNSPAEISRADLDGRIVVHRTGAGTQGLLAAANRDPVLAASFLNASATARYLLASGAEEISLVAMGWNGTDPAAEDQECALFLERLLQGDRPDFAPVRERIRNDPTGQRFFDPSLPWFTEEDFDFCMQLDRFAMAIVTGPHPETGLCLRASHGSRA